MVVRCYSQDQVGQRVALLWGEVDMVATLTGGRNQKAEYIVRGGAPFKDIFKLKKWHSEGIGLAAVC